MSDTPLKESELYLLKDQNESLEIKCRQLRNKLRVIEREKNENAIKYLEVVTEVENKNEELNELKNSLEERVKEQTAELRFSNEALQREVTEREEAQRKAEKMAKEAEAASEAKTEFLATMSHEIRTPLNAIINLTRITLDSILNDSQRHNMETVLASSDHLLALINEILDLSKIEAGKLELENVDFDLRHLLETTIRGLRITAEKKKLTLDMSIDVSCLRVFRGDMNRVRQIVINLIGNAIKFTEKGGVTVSVCQKTPFELKIGDSVELLFSIRDSGLGIPSDKLEMIFENFNQVDSSVSRQYGGTGLGLSICKKLVEMMGGNIWVESEFGKGSEFFFTLLLKVGDESKVKRIDEQVLRSLAWNKEAYILLVEDNKVNVEVATYFIKEMGHKLEFAENGKKAVEMVSKHDFDLVLMDIEMPVMDGYEATRQIREGKAGEEKKDIPIIAMTAHAGNQFREKCIAAGMNDYITKPVDDTELAIRIATFLSEDMGALTLEQLAFEGDENATASRGEEISSETVVVDVEKALRLYGGDRAFFETLCGVYVDESQKLVDKIEEALEVEDAPLAGTHAHALKSAAASIGAEKAREIAVAMEKAGKNNDVELTRKLLVDFSEMNKKVIAEIS